MMTMSTIEVYLYAPFVVLEQAMMQVVFAEKWSKPQFGGDLGESRMVGG